MVLFRHLLTCIFTLLLFPVLAQEPAQPVRVELPFDMETTNVEVIALPDSSLLVYYTTGNLWKTEATFNFTKFNHQLEQLWSDTVNMPSDSYYIRHYTEAPYTYLVFGQDDLQEYTFVKLNHSTGQLQQKHYELEPIDAIYEYSVLNDNYFIIGRNRKDQKPVLLHLNTDTNEIQLLPSIYGEESAFSDLLADPANNRVDAVLSESNGRISRLQVKSFNARGKLLKSHFILQQEDKSLLNAEITPGDSTQKMLFGTYGTRDLRYNQGFFTTPVTTSVVDEEGRFYSMLQLKNFFKYLKPRQEERTRRREAARLKTGKSPRYRYRLLLHDLIDTPEGYILAAEVYYPQYRSSNTNWGIDRSFSVGRQEEGYKRTHAVALGFDKQGRLLWDNAFPLKDVVSYDLVHTVEVGRLPDGRVVMAYPREEQIIYHIMDHSKFDEEETELDILTYEEDERIQDTIEPGIIRWYGNSFAAFGFQRIKPKSESSRTVFYINRIDF
ncbi:hypothetical protein [Pontibacter pamirensis]|uniref:hypothetical protein n=1 Tax=Pontibacter pamirensis TaxID=2562824 RepID=UPI00138A0056|nr:hypothetical protein [Pontibacter pamirensis]